MPLPLIEVLQDGNQLVTLVRYHVPHVHRHLRCHAITLPRHGFMIACFVGESQRASIGRSVAVERDARALLFPQRG